MMRLISQTDRSSMQTLSSSNNKCKQTKTISLFRVIRFRTTWMTWEWDLRVQSKMMMQINNSFNSYNRISKCSSNNCLFKTSGFTQVCCSSSKLILSKHNNSTALTPCRIHRWWCKLLIITLRVYKAFTSQTCISHQMQKEQWRSVLELEAAENLYQSKRIHLVSSSWPTDWSSLPSWTLR